jgi:hypothetical protein
VLELSQNAKNMTKIIFFTKYFSSLYVPLKEASTRMDYVLEKGVSRPFSATGPSKQKINKNINQLNQRQNG